jgi:propanediol dehydratase small subunit
MSEERLSIADYPLAEKRPEIVRGKRGKGLDEITLEALLEDHVTLEDLRITGAALRQQAEIARAAGRGTLAANFERAAELVDVPQDTIMRIYELLRPGRAQSQDEFFAAARGLRDQYGAKGLAAFVEEAAAVYERRGLFKKRF